MKLPNTFIHLIGFSGVGKYTIAKEIASRTDARIIDNHLINNPIFNVLDMNSGKELPREAWRYIDHVRDAVFEVIKTFSPPEFSFIFTNALLSGDDKYQRVLDQVMDLAEERQARYLPVRLFCSTDENVRRITQLQREERLKPVDPSRMLGQRAQKTLINLTHENLLDLDITNLSASQAAEAILLHTETLGTA